jgi:acyl carrier protein
MTDTMAALKELLHQEFDVDLSTLKVDAPLADYGLDSLSLAELLFAIEEHFNLDIPIGRQGINSLADVAALIDELRIPKAA